MTTIQAGLTYYKQVNEKVREAAEKDDNITIENVIGQRYIGCGSSGEKYHGTRHPGQRPRPVPQRLDARGVRQRAGGGRRHDERGRYHHPRQRRRRLRLRHARRPHLHRGRLRLPRRHPHEGLSGALPRRRHRRQGRLVPRRIPQAASSSFSASARTAHIRSTIFAERVCTAAGLC